MTSRRPTLPKCRLLGSWHGPSGEPAEGKSLPKGREVQNAAKPRFFGVLPLLPRAASHTLPPGGAIGRTDGWLLASPRALAKPGAAGRNASGLFFSLDSSTYFANDPFPPFTPNYTGIGSSRL